MKNGKRTAKVPMSTRQPADLIQQMDAYIRTKRHLNRTILVENAVRGYLLSKSISTGTKGVK